MKNWRLWLGICVSALCLYLAARGLDLASLLQALQRVNYWLLVPALGLVVLGLWLRAVRWRLLLQSSGGPKLARLYNLTSIGYLFNSVLPLRAGDLLRSYLLAELEKLDVARVLSTVLLERIADILIILFLLLILIPFVVLPDALVGPVIGIAVVAILAAILLGWVAARGQRSLQWAEGLLRRCALLNRPWLRRSLAAALEGVSALGSWGRALRLGVWSLAIWLVATLQLYVVMWAAGLRLPWTAALAVICFTSLGMTVPSSPGYVGVYEYLTVLALGLFNLSRESALGYALLAHAVGYVGFVVPGVIAVGAEGYSYASLNARLRQAEDHTLPT